MITRVALSRTLGYSSRTSSGRIALRTANAGRRGVTGRLDLQTGTSSDGSSGMFSMVSGTATDGHGDIEVKVGRGNAEMGNVGRWRGVIREKPEVEMS